MAKKSRRQHKEKQKTRKGQKGHRERNWVCHMLFKIIVVYLFNMNFKKSYCDVCNIPTC